MFLRACIYFLFTNWLLIPDYADMSTSIFIEALAVNDYVARLLGWSTATTFRLSQADFEKVEI